MNLFLLDIIEDTVVDGPGFRTSLYAAGCRHHCPGCHNPQSWEREHGHAVGVEEVAERLLTDPFSNITFSGGDPLEQVEAFTELAKLIKNKSNQHLRDTDLLFRGSSNQRLIDVPESLLKGKIQLYDYSPYPVIAV